MPIGWWWYVQMTVEIFARKGENKGGTANSVCVGKKEWRVGRQGALNFKQAPPLTTFRDLNQWLSPAESVSTCVKWKYWYLSCLSYRSIRRIQWIIHLWLLLWKHYEKHKDSYLEIWVLIIIFVCFSPISTVISNAGNSDGKNLPAMQEMWVQSLSQEDPLEKGTATHSSILTWRIPWTVKSMGLQRVGHDWVLLPWWPRW